MVNRKQQKDITAEESKQSSVSELPGNMTSEEERRQDMERLLLSETELSVLDDDEQRKILDELDLDNIPEVDLIQQVQNKVDNVLSGENKRKEISQENYNRALAFFKREILPGINSDFSGVKITRFLDSPVHYREWDEIRPYQKDCDIGKKFEFARLFTDVERSVKRLQHIYGNELGDIHPGGFHGSVKYVGSNPIAGEETRSDYNHETGRDEEYVVYHLRVTPVKEAERVDFYGGDYCVVDANDYGRYLEEISDLVGNVESTTFTAPEDSKELKEIEELIKRFEGSIFPVPEGVKPFEWLSLKLGVNITEREEDEVVHYIERMMYPGTGVRYLETADHYHIFNAERSNQKVEKKGEEFIAGGSREICYSGRVEEFDIKGDSGSVVAHEVETQDQDTGVSSVTSSCLVNVDVWPNTDSAELVNNILEARYGKGADISFLEALKNEQAAINWIKEKYATLERGGERWYLTQRKLPKEERYCDWWTKKLIRQLFRKFPSLRGRIAEEFDVKEWLGEKW